MSACVSGHWCNSVYKQQEVDLPQFLDRGGYELHRLEDISSRVSGLQSRVRLSLMSLNKNTVGGLFLEPLTKYLCFTAYFQNDQPKCLWEGECFPGGISLNLGKEFEDLMMENSLITISNRGKMVCCVFSFKFSDHVFPTALQISWCMRLTSVWEQKHLHQMKICSKKITGRPLEKHYGLQQQKYCIVSNPHKLLPSKRR